VPVPALVIVEEAHPQGFLSGSPDVGGGHDFDEKSARPALTFPMLTPVDVHSLVGLLSVPAGPENVEVVVEEEVDLTITARDKDGKVTAFHGIEVKDCARPLDVAEVEQLCAKVKETPGPTSHAIVSACGYTKLAVRKARHHAVVPWSLEHLDDPSKGVDQVRWFESVGQPEVIFRRVDRRESRYFDGNLPVRLHDGSENASLRTVADWAGHVVASAINRIIDGEEFQPRLSQFTDGHVDTFGSVAVTFDQPLLFGPPESSFAVDGALVTGAIACRTSTTKLDFRILVEAGDDVPFAGCGIAVLPEGNLVALSTNNIARTVNVLNVPLTDRLKEQIGLQTVK
jgi:hypothetical protein